jgi:PHD/YefM family antitoxin component YafN of YafNO toxin-antitoxin module
MPKATAKPKSARETLMETVTRIREEARQRMSEDEFREVEDKVHELANKVRASRGRKRETA